jgi:hypothetical protein
MIKALGAASYPRKSKRYLSLVTNSVTQDIDLDAEEANERIRWQSARCVNGAKPIKWGNISRFARQPIAIFEPLLGIQ